MADNAKEAKKDRGTFESSLATFAKRVQEAKAARPGSIAFHATGVGSGAYRIHTGQGRPRVVAFGRATGEKQPLIEVIGEAATLRAILDGKKDALKTFVGGGLRVRGDLAYLSELALELGLIEKPL
jgi:SCP-2 sterol transfer family